MALCLIKHLPPFSLYILHIQHNHFRTSFESQHPQFRFKLKLTQNYCGSRNEMLGFESWIRHSLVLSLLHL